jgi:hypothetical protein
VRAVKIFSLWLIKNEFVEISQCKKFPFKNKITGEKIMKRSLILATILLCAIPFGCEENGSQKLTPIQKTTTSPDKIEPKTDPTPAPKTDPTPAPKIDPTPAPKIDPTPTPKIDPIPTPLNPEVKPIIPTVQPPDKNAGILKSPLDKNQPDKNQSDKNQSDKNPPDKNQSDKNQPNKAPSDNAKAALEIVKKLGGTSKLSADGELTLINVDGASMTADMFDVFGKQAELETLQVTNFRGLNDEVFAKILGLKKLKTLAVTNAIITDASAANLVKSFPSIRVLDLSRNAYLTDEALSHLGKLKELESLVINYCTFSEFGLIGLENSPKLRALDIRGNVNISTSAIGIIAKMPALRSLKHMSNVVDDSAISALVDAKNLETLDMYDFTITDAAGEYLNKLPKLTHLIIFRCSNFGSQGLLALKEKPLKRLTLRDLSQLDDSGMEAFRSMKSLKLLYLHELNSVGDAGMANLENLKELDLLDIWSMPLITDKSIESISKLPKLKSVSIRSTGITDKSVDLLLTLPKLENLTLKDNASISESAKTKLKESKKFKTLTLDTTQK